MRDRVRVVVFDDEICVSDMDRNRLHLEYSEAFEFCVEIEFLKMMDEIDGNHTESYSHRGLRIPASQVQDVADDISQWLRQFRVKPKPKKEVDWSREGF
ncbi:hypothetical protein CA54_41330 [Symmachiella macrocystis]|uniref:Uncharacterized protein n=1 Tax=Symmachiella macrocystis TaxID=2527985 RepID=A0A5C6BEK6_9PLAN|nr:hypothetical protein [Symmachiella macrocystis]TWU08894.1 hypothetical protein CA54_41330 [Symmachiella macrocystis]